jgi:hypothetical protein
VCPIDNNISRPPSVASAKEDPHFQLCPFRHSQIILLPLAMVEHSYNQESPQEQIVADLLVAARNFKKHPATNNLNEVLRLLEMALSVSHPAGHEGQTTL